MRRQIMIRIIVILTIFVWLLSANILSAQLRIVSYNTTPTVNHGLADVLEAIGNQSVNGIQRPIDILGLQEQPNQQTETQAIVNLLNLIYGQDVYARGNLNGAGFMITQGVIYNTDTVELIAEKRVGSVSNNGAARQGLRYQFRPVGYGPTADFYVYNSHFKASNDERNAMRRNVEAIALRRDAAQLGDAAAIIYLGDLNLYRNTEPAFQTMTAAGTGQAIDPVDQIGNWHNNGRYLRWHTQSTTTAGGENRAGGGVDDRFDFQLVTETLLDGEGMSYIGPQVPNNRVAPMEHSYRVFGNNGSHFRNRNISTGSGADMDILLALESASDHLPVVADYQVPAILSASLQFPKRLLIHADVTGTANVQNVADVQSPIGADELDYSIFSLSGISIQETGSALATAEVNQHPFQMDTSSVGPKTGTLVVSSESSQDANRLFQETASFTVLDHANASFKSNHDTDELTIDLGNIPQGELNTFLEFDVPVFNFATSDFTARLHLENTILQNGPFTLNVFESLIEPGSSDLLKGRLTVANAGTFQTSFTLQGTDEDLPGAQSIHPLTLTLLATVDGEILGDFDKDLQLTVHDLELLSKAMRSDSNNVQFDLTGDMQVTQADRLEWIEVLKSSYVGDANLDGEFNSGDLILVFQAGEYLDALEGNSTWETGDWDGDGEFDTPDLVLAFQRGGYEVGARTAWHVPESSARWLIWFALLLAFDSNRCRTRNSPGSK